MLDLAGSGSVEGTGRIEHRSRRSANHFLRLRPGSARRLVLAVVLSLTCLVPAVALPAADAIHGYVFLIDTSASMRENKLVGPLRVALDDFADTIPKDGTSQVWIYTFDRGLGRNSLKRLLNRTEDLQEAKIFLNEIDYQGTATYVYQALDRVLTDIDRTMADGTSHDFTIHLFTDGADNGPTTYSFAKNAERFSRLRKSAGNAVEFYYHALKIEIPPALAKLIEHTEGMYSIPGVGMPPKARFSLPKVDITDSAPVTFLNRTIGQVDDHEWKFGDGTVSNDENPTHAFKTPGKYTVTLVASNPAGKSTTSKEVVVRGGPPQAKLAIHEPDKPKYVGEPIRFIDQSTGQITRRAWKFGDAVQETTTTQAEFTFRDPGQIKVSLAVLGPFGKDICSAFVTIEHRPSVGFSFFPKEPVQKKDVLFVNASKGNLGSWLWKFGDAATSEQMSPVHAYAQAGKYKVELSGLDSTGARLTSSADIVVGTGYVKPEAKFALPVKTIGIGEPLTLTDQSSGTSESWTWDMGDGTIIETPAATHTYKQAGSYTVSLTVSGPAGSSTTTDTLVVKSATLGFSIRPAQPRDHTPVTFVNEAIGNYRQWKWDFGDGQSSVDKNPQHEYEKPGEYVVTLAAIGPDEKLQQSKATVAVKSSAVAPKAQFVLQVAVLETHQPLVLSHTSTGTITTVQWDMGDGVRLTGDTATHQYAKPGQYTIILTVSNSTDSDSASQTLSVTNVYRQPSISFRAAGPVKGAAPFRIEVVNGCKGSIRSFKWDFGDGSISDDRDSLTHTYESPGQYTISLTIVDQKDQTFSSTSSQNVVVEVLPPPPPPRYPASLPWSVAAGWYGLAWLCVWRRWWPWSRRSIHYQQDGRPHHHTSWQRDLVQDGFQIVLCRTVLLKKIYRYLQSGGGVSARSLAGELSDGDRIKAGCKVETADSKRFALGRLNDRAWTSLVPHAFNLLVSVALLVVLTKLRCP